MAGEELVDMQKEEHWEYIRVAKKHSRLLLRIAIGGGVAVWLTFLAAIVVAGDGHELATRILYPMLYVSSTALIGGGLLATVLEDEVREHSRSYQEHYHERWEAR